MAATLNGIDIIAPKGGPWWGILGVWRGGASATEVYGLKPKTNRTFQLRDAINEKAP